MNKPKDAADGSEKFREALFTQHEVLYGFRGSDLEKSIASRIQYVMWLLDPDDKGLIQKIFTLVSKEKLQDMFRCRMIEELETCDSDFYRLMTEINTAVKNGDSAFFRKIANGLDHLPKETEEPMWHMSQAYLFWMCASKMRPYVTWTLPDYELDVENGIEPTKKQIRELTQRFWAVERLESKKRLRFCQATEKQSAEIEGLINEEILHLKNLIGHG